MKIIVNWVRCFKNYFSYFPCCLAQKPHVQMLPQSGAIYQLSFVLAELVGSATGPHRGPKKSHWPLEAQRSFDAKLFVYKEQRDKKCPPTPHLASTQRTAGCRPVFAGLPVQLPHSWNGVGWGAALGGPKPGLTEPKGRWSPPIPIRWQEELPSSPTLQTFEAKGSQLGGSERPFARLPRSP